jgi:UPF0176 protein
MYCTGGIRCEKLQLTLNTKVLKCMYQLEGGIINYAKANKGGKLRKQIHWKKLCFDHRFRQENY